MKQNMPIKCNYACVYTVDMQKKKKKKASEGTINLGASLILMITCFLLPENGRNPLREISFFGLFPPPFWVLC